MAADGCARVERPKIMISCVRAIVQVSITSGTEEVGRPLSSPRIALSNGLPLLCYDNNNQTKQVVDTILSYMMLRQRIYC